MVRPRGILFAGGGTGGHIMPGLAVAEACRNRGMVDIRWVGDPERLEARLVPQAHIPLLPWGLNRPRLKDPRWLIGAVIKMWCIWHELRQRPPQVIVALGGYAALIPGLLAPLLRRPLVVMEQNARPGKTNRLLARVAVLVCTQFAEADRSFRRDQVRRLGNPVRMLQAYRRGRQQQLWVLIMGGSLAAKSLNDLCAAAAPHLAAITNLRIIHLAGEADRARMQSVYAEHGIAAEVLGFCDDMPSLYERVDVMLGRAGATSVAECCAAGIGALYIPLPWAADDHQTANARAVARVGGAVVLPQATIKAAGLARVMKRLDQDRDLVTTMGRCAQTLARPHAADDVAHHCARVARSRGRNV